MVSSSLLGNVSVSADGPLGCGVVTTTVRVQATGSDELYVSGANGYNQSNPTGVFTVTRGAVTRHWLVSRVVWCRVR